ncbi:MAG: hypothetical protein L6Q99_07765 [Planctomycetes bacterium]|nr:hypothetical protein [Planctomycetota bacterium]
MSGRRERVEHAGDAASSLGTAAAAPSLRRFTPLAVFVLAFVWLAWGSGSRALWQDEAATALLGKSFFAHGKPLAHHAGNLVTMDDFRAAEEPALAAAMKSVDTALPYLAARGDFAADTTWIGHPWGSFVLAGLVQALGATSDFALRLPFVLCGALAVLLLFVALERRVGVAPAVCAAVLLAFNVYWFVHVRQCRYYAPASLGALATFVGYLRWREGARFGAAAFVSAAAAWFLFDFGSPFAALGVFALDAVGIARKRPRELALVFGALALLFLPQVVAFDLVNRLRPTDTPFSTRLAGLGFFVNQYVLGFLLAAAALGLVVFSRSAGAAARRTTALALVVLAAELLWLSQASPYPFVRYVIGFAPLGAWVTALLVHELGRRFVPARPLVVAVPLVLLVALSPVFSAPLSRALSPEFDELCAPGRMVRAELAVLGAELTRTAPDPNRAVVEFLRPKLAPGDEVLANYEDLPLAHYLGVPIRGGIAGFRVEDPRPARFVVLRRSVSWVHWRAYERALQLGRYRQLPLDAPDLPWGNNPDPPAHWSRFPTRVAPLTVLERVD